MGAALFRLLWLCLCACFAACNAPPPEPRITMEHPQGPEGTPGTPLASRPEIGVTISAPARVPYDGRVLGHSGRMLGIRLTNLGRETVPIGIVRTRFTSAREGVSFACAEREAIAPRRREPTKLGPRESFEFMRELACSLPLTGVWQVGVSIALGFPGKENETFDSAGSFATTVEGGTRTPRAHPSKPGLHMMMTGGHASTPLPEEAWRRGDYRLVVAFINASGKPIEIGASRLKVSVYKTGSPLPCSGEAENLAGPMTLHGGQVVVVRAPVTCAPSQEGLYEIVGGLELPDSPEYEIGRVGLRVSSDPFLFLPLR